MFLLYFQMMMAGYSEHVLDTTSHLSDTAPYKDHLKCNMPTYERKHLHTQRYVTVICKPTRSGNRSTRTGWLMYLTVSVLFPEPFCDSLPLSIPLKIFRLSALLHLLFLHLSLGCMTLAAHGSYVSQMMQPHMTSFAVTLWMQ
jgi:hypothetical protein